MKFSEWSALQSEDQQRLCQGLNPYEDWSLFKEIEAEFMRRYGEQPAVASAFCGLASGVGPANAITVSIKRGAGRARFPRHFLGFPTLRSYDRGARSAA